MNPTEEKNSSENIGREVRRDKMAEFERQFRDPEKGNRLREGVTINEVMEKAGLVQKQWAEIPLALHPSIFLAHRKGHFGVSARPWETENNYTIFGGGSGSYYFMYKNRGNDFAWSRLWVDGHTPRMESINHDSTLDEVIANVAYHEFGERPMNEEAVVEKTREKAKKNLRPWENK
jgi:hypothetical protein